MERIEELKIFLNAKSNEELDETRSNLCDEIRAFWLDDQIKGGKFCVTKKDREFLAEFLEDHILLPRESIPNFSLLRENLAMEVGRRKGFWEDWDENGPIANAAVFKQDQFGPEGQVAHILVELKIFPSLTQARKNGFGTPIQPGEFVFTKKKIRVRVVA